MMCICKLLHELLQMNTIIEHILLIILFCCVCINMNVMSKQFTPMFMCPTCYPTAQPTTYIQSSPPLSAMLAYQCIIIRVF